MKLAGVGLFHVNPRFHTTAGWDLRSTWKFAASKLLWNAPLRSLPVAYLTSSSGRVPNTVWGIPSELGSLIRENMVSGSMPGGVPVYLEGYACRSEYVFHPNHWCWCPDGLFGECQWQSTPTCPSQLTSINAEKWHLGNMPATGQISCVIFVFCATTVTQNTKISQEIAE